MSLAGALHIGLAEGDLVVFGRYAALMELLANSRRYAGLSKNTTGSVPTSAVAIRPLAS